MHPINALAFSTLLFNQWLRGHSLYTLANLILALNEPATDSWEWKLHRIEEITTETYFSFQIACKYYNGNSTQVCLFMYGLPIFTDYCINHCSMLQSVKITLLGSNILFQAVEVTAFSSRSPASHLFLTDPKGHQPYTSCPTLKKSHQPGQVHSKTTKHLYFSFSIRRQPMWQSLALSLSGALKTVIRIDIETPVFHITYNSA